MTSQCHFLLEETFLHNSGAATREMQYGNVATLCHAITRLKRFVHFSGNECFSVVEAGRSISGGNEWEKRGYFMR